MNTTQRVGSWLMLASILAGCAGQEATPTATSSSPVTAASAQLPRVGLVAPIHFAAPDGTDQLVQVGTYRVEGAGGTHLRLVTDTPQAVQEISATAFAHEETLAAPVSFIVREVEHEETVHLLFILPDGKGLDAAGRIGDIQTRGGDLRFQPRSQYSGVVMQQSLQQAAANAQKRLDMQRQIEEQKKQLEALQRQLEEAQDRNGVEKTIGGLFGTDGGAGAVSANSVIHMESARCKTCKIFLTR